MVNNILKPKSQEDIEREISSMSPVDQFCFKFKYRYEKDPNYGKILELISEINVYNLPWTISKSAPDYINPRAHAYDQEITINIEYQETFNTYHRALYIIGPRVHIHGNDIVTVTNENTVYGITGRRF